MLKRIGRVNVLYNGQCANEDVCILVFGRCSFEEQTMVVDE